MTTPFFGEKIPEFTVTQFNTFVDQILGQMTVCVRGEISGFKILQQKWVTFDLKDDESRVNCFASKFQLGTAFEDGMSVKVTGKPGIYVPYGKYSFRIQSIELVGEGALLRAFSLLQQKLSKEGLFDSQHKKPLPKYPRTIGIITSSDAAAYTDILRILDNRWQGLQIYHGHVAVQGATAGQEIATMIDWFNKHHPVDVLLVSRGGGSLEDLQAFNSEIVVRSIFASQIPVVVGVGHERDTTLADFVADVRASTPSNAAEIVVPDQTVVLQTLRLYEQRIPMLLLKHLQKLELLCDNYTNRVSGFFRFSMQIVKQKTEQMVHILKNFETNILNKLAICATNEKLFLQHHPHTTLQKGYSMTKTKGGILVRSVRDAPEGTVLVTHVHDGAIHSRVGT